MKLSTLFLSDLILTSNFSQNQQSSNFILYFLHALRFIFGHFKLSFWIVTHFGLMLVYTTKPLSLEYSHLLSQASTPISIPIVLSSPLFLHLMTYFPTKFAHFWHLTLTFYIYRYWMIGMSSISYCYFRFQTSVVFAF